MRRDACEVICLLSLTHPRAPLVPLQSKYGGCFSFEKRSVKVREKLGQSVRMGMQRCKSATKGSKAVSQTATLAAALGGRKDNGSRLISLFGLLV